MAGFLASLTFMESLFLLTGGIGTLFFVLRAVSLIMGISSNSGSEYGEISDGGDVSSFQDLDGNGVPDILETEVSTDIHIDTDVQVDTDFHVDTDVHVDTDIHSGDTGSFHHDTDTGAHSDYNTDADGNKLPDVLDATAVTIKVKDKLIDFSLQNICGFFMAFGWMGLIMTRLGGYGSILASFAGGILGFITAIIYTKINQNLMKLQSSGNKVITSTIGKIGTVYLRIPAEGTGQIQVNVSGRLDICDAESIDHVEIPYGEEVQVVKVKNTKDGGKILCVTNKFLKV